MITRRTAVAGALVGSAALAQPAAASASTGAPGWLRPRAGAVALTFDDGPSSMTPYVLTVLAALGVRATFFVQGEHAARRPDLVRRIAWGGHVIGNHGWSHTSFEELNEAEARSEIERTNAAVRAATGRTPTLFRYPYGTSTATGDAILSDLGMRGGVLWHWTVPLPGDFECPGADGVTQYVLQNAVDDAIILLHDGNEVTDCSPFQPTYLSRVILTLRARGFRFGVVAPAAGPNPVNGDSAFRVAT